MCALCQSSPMNGRGVPVLNEIDHRMPCLPPPEALGLWCSLNARHSYSSLTNQVGPLLQLYFWLKKKQTTASPTLSPQTSPPTPVSPPRLHHLDPPPRSATSLVGFQTVCIPPFFRVSGVSQTFSPCILMYPPPPVPHSIPMHNPIFPECPTFSLFPPSPPIFLIDVGHLF